MSAYLEMTSPIKPVSPDRLPTAWPQYTKEAESLGLQGIAEVGVAAAATMLGRFDDIRTLFDAPLFVAGSEGYDVIHPKIAQVLAWLNPDEAKIANAGIGALFTVRGLQAIVNREGAVWRQTETDSTDTTTHKLRYDIRANMIGVTDLLGTAEGAFIHTVEAHWQQKGDVPARSLEIAATMRMGLYFNNYQVLVQDRIAAHPSLGFEITEARDGFLRPVTAGLPQQCMRLGQTMILGAKCAN